jgi:hypothetical protein
MDANLNVTIWLKDFSILKNWTLTRSGLTVDGTPLDINKLAKVDNAYLYFTDGSQVYRDRISGTIKVAGPGVSGSLTLNIDQVEELLVNGPGE